MEKLPFLKRPFSKIPTVMPTDDNRKATLNARERKLQKDAHGNILTRDSTKQQQKDQKELQNFLGSLNFFYEKVKRDPSIWKKEHLQSSRAFVQHILENQEDFPLDSSVNIERLIPSSNQHQYDQNQVETLLTDGFVQSITNKSWSYVGFLEYDEETNRSKQKRQRN